MDCDDVTELKLVAPQPATQHLKLEMYVPDKQAVVIVGTCPRGTAEASRKSAILLAKVVGEYCGWIKMRDT